MSQDPEVRSDWTSTQSPAPGIPAGTFSIRLTGEITFPEAGTYTLETHVDDGVRFFIDDKLIAESWILGAPRPITGNFTAVAGASHRIRIDYYNDRGAGQLHLNWRRPPSGTYETIPGQYLKPLYGLTTSTIEYEHDPFAPNGVPHQVTRTSFDGLDPVYGLATATTVGAGMLPGPTPGELTTSTGYEVPGTGYLRTTTKTLPAGTQTTYQHYGDAEQRDNPCTSENDPANQGGMVKISNLPTPATGQARFDEQVYDSSGRVVAKSTSGDWSCTSYDARDRAVRQTHPATQAMGERIVTTNHAVDGNPLVTSVTDFTGTITTRVDLLGRTVEYTDAVGTRTTTSYDRAGRVTSETVTPPNPADSPQVTTYTHDDAGRVLTVSLDSTVLATTTYNTAGELASVTYGNGSSLAAIGRDPAGRTTSHTWRTSDNVDVVTAVTRTRNGTVTDESLAGVDARPDGPNFTYDAPGRLVEAWVPGHHYTYDFTSTADAACPTGTRANAGLNTNRVRLLDETASGTAETKYCYDDADRLLATLGATMLTDVQYDDNGNTTQYSHNGHTTHFSWDGADRNIAVRTLGPDPADVGYTRDATDRIIRRTVATGDGTSEVHYSYSADGDAADLALDGAKKVLTRSVGLPGGVLHTWKPVATDRTYDHPTVRGDLTLTTDQSGLQQGALRSYGPFGESLSTTVNDGLPDNQPGDMDYGWLGQHQRPHEHAGALSIVQMGARPYSPLLGRFLSVDLVDGGSANDYDYVHANPVNEIDLDGERARKRWGGRSPAFGSCWSRYSYMRACLGHRANKKWWRKGSRWIGRWIPGMGRCVRCTKVLISAAWRVGSKAINRMRPINWAKGAAGCLLGMGAGSSRGGKIGRFLGPKGMLAGGFIGGVAGCAAGAWTAGMW